LTISVTDLPHCSVEVGFFRMDVFLCRLLWQSYSVQQLCEAGIGAEIVESRIDLDEDNTRAVGKCLI
jgi:hypothetical protein